MILVQNTFVKNLVKDINNKADQVARGILICAMQRSTRQLQ